MILGSNRMLPAGPFLAALQRAVRGVCRVRSERSALGTAWLVTDTLLVAPSFFSDVEPGGFFVDRAGGEDVGEPIRVETVAVVPDARDTSGVLLLRLSRPLPDRALAMQFRAVEPERWAFVLHHPEGGELTLSIGRVARVTEDHRLAHDADTVGGSSGGPILDGEGLLIGMHTEALRGERLNAGPSRALIVEHLRRTPAWPEIAALHRIADVQAAERHFASRPVASEPGDPERPAPPLLYAAVRSTVDPAALPPDARDELAKRVADAKAPRWTLKASERRRLLLAAGSLDALRSARGDAPPEDARQRAIDAVLRGPPYDLAAASEDELSAWIPVAGWFHGVAPGLPSATDVTRTLERRRVRSRLDRIVGAKFRGRDDELAAMRAWYDDAGAGPLVITAIGGMGKSALVARFAASLPATTLLLWLDFDRADLAPDDAVSVLHAIAAQAVAQLDAFEPPQVTPETWQHAADELGRRLAAALDATTGPRAPRPLLVLDSFEVAQHSTRYQEIWPVLAALAANVPIGVVVTGRAEVPGLALNGRAATSMKLAGLGRGHAEAWLREHDVRDATTLDLILDRAAGVPLILTLVGQLMQSGGTEADLRAAFESTVIEGFLYQRILDRVVDQELRELAQGALVLRRLTAEMIEPVLGGVVALPGRAPERLFADLAREMALVEGTDVLRLRPEVRSAALWMLGTVRAEMVRAIDERAAQWYAGRVEGEPALAAELVYHLLRLGRVDDAARAWRSGCEDDLRGAEADLEGAARSWLAARVGSPSKGVALEKWERDAAARVRDALARDQLRLVPEIVAERGERSAESPLPFLTAYYHWRNGDVADAARVLDAAGGAAGTVGRDRAVMAALLAAKRGDRHAVDERLAEVDHEARWGQPLLGIAWLAVRAARIRNAVDSLLELLLLEDFLGTERGDLKKSVSRVLAPHYLALPRSRALLEEMAPRRSLEAATQQVSLRDVDDGPGWIVEQLVAARPRNSFNSVLMRDVLLGPMWTLARLETASEHATLPAGDLSLDALRVASRLVAYGLWRWRLALRDDYLLRASALAEAAESESALARATAASLALFTARVGPAYLGGQHDAFASVLHVHAELHLSRPLTRDGLERVRAALPALVSGPGLDASRADLERARRVPRLLLEDPETTAMLLYFLSPDPLETLVHALAGVAVEP